MARTRIDGETDGAAAGAGAGGDPHHSAASPSLMHTTPDAAAASVAASTVVAAALADGHGAGDALVHAYMNLATTGGHADAAAASATSAANAPPAASVSVVTTSAGASGAALTGTVSQLLPTRCPPFRESYSDMGELRRELKVLSVRMGLPYYMQHSSPQRLEARCPTWKHRKTTPTTCEFVVSANRHTNGRVFVTRAVVAHSGSCTMAQANPGSYISAAALMETAKPFMLQAGGDTVRPKDMASIMKDQFGVSTSYMTAWRALSAFRQQKRLEESSSYTKIRGYLDAFVKNNDGSVAAFEHLPDTTTFARAFLCPKPLQLTVRYCRATILLSVFLVTSAFGGVLMTATTQDAMGENVPVAVGIAPAESDENWLFFLQQLHKAIPDVGRAGLTFVHSRGEELQRPLHELFPACHQSDTVELFATATATGGVSASAASSDSGASAGVAPPDHPFQWLESLSTKTPLMILVGWVSKVASTLFQRFEKYGQISTEYAEEFHALLVQYEAETDHYEVLRISENGFEVVDHQTGRQRIVDFAKQTCTCGEYDVSRFPCLHVFLAISFAGMMRTDVIPRMYLMSSLKALYGGRITPIDVETVESDGVTVPIPQPKSRGRPRKVQQIQQFGDAKQEKLACSICGVKGHNKRTCKRGLADGNGGGSHDLGAGLHAGGSVVEEDVEPTFLDSTYEEDLPFDHSALHHSSEHQIAMEEAAAEAIHAVASKHQQLHASDESPSATKRRKLSAGGAGAALDDASKDEEHHIKGHGHAEPTVALL